MCLFHIECIVLLLFYFFSQTVEEGRVNYRQGNRGTKDSRLFPENTEKDQHQRKWTDSGGYR